MIKKIIFYLFLLPVFAFGQMANDWIDYNQDYFKFPIVNDGVYRISYLQLINAGVNITNIDPRSIQIFARGEEQSIYVEGENDGVFDPNDFIELYCEPNDGWYDHALFSDSAHILNPHYSMYTDTAYYFLTWNQTVGNKRMVSDVDLNFNSYTPSPYFWHETKRVGTKTHCRGQTTPFGWSVPEYSEAEGWFESQVVSQNSATKKLNTPFKKVGGPDGWVKTKIGGLGAYTHFVEVYLNDSMIYKDDFFDRKSVLVEHAIPDTWIEDETELEYKSVTPIVNSKDKFLIAYSHIRYAREYNLGSESSFMMHVPPGAAAKDLLEITNYDNLSKTVRLYDITGGTRITVQPLSGKYYALVPNKGIERKCFITSDASIRSVDNLRPVSGGSPQFINYESEISGNGGVDYLLLSASKLMSAAEDYGDYRQNNGLKTTVVDIDQLYDQFSFGIRKHPMSIKNFVGSVLNDWGYTPEYLFLCGKSIAMSYPSARRGGDVGNNLVPTWSVLGSDAGLTQGLKAGGILDPALSTGRIAATTEQQLRDYLDKVKEYESADPADWMKKVLHFGGGTSATEQAQFKTYLDSFEVNISGSNFGGDVHTFLKNSSDPLQLNVSDSVTNLINDGVSMMTFFGHAYGNNFDQSIDEPENYDNDGKYPFILANSCLIGNIHKTSLNSGSERFVLSKGKGAIGFLASSSLGVPNYLFQYSNTFYKKMSTDYYGWPVGKLVQQTVLDMQDSINTLNRDVCLHMTLHCDPAIVLNSQPKADYTVYGKQGLTQPNVFFQPKIVSSDIDSFSVNVVVTNIGKSIGDSMSLTVTRYFPSSNIKDTTYTLLLSDIYYSDTISIKLPVDKLNGVGLNSFSVFVDALSEVDEMDELNNTVDVDLFIESSDLVPVFPYEFAIVPDQETALKASTGNPYAKEEKYYFQIDTNDNFSSPSFYEEVILSKGGVLELNPTSSVGLSAFYKNFPSSTTISSPQVFFWRVSSDSTGVGGFNWKSSSFQHVSGKRGWGQAHFHQFEKDEFLFLDYKKNQRDLEFVKQTKSIGCATHKDASFFISQGIKYDINGAIQCFHSMHWAHMFFVAVIDKKTLEPWHPQDHGDYGHINYAANKVNSAMSAKNFYFNMGSSVGVDSLISFINDVPDSNYVLMYNYRSHNCGTWLNPIQPVAMDFENMMDGVGADVDSLKKYPSNYPYILFFQKGKPASAIESFSSTGTDYIYLHGDLVNNWVNGYINSTIIGPSTEWGSLHWSLDNDEIGNTGDTAFIDVYGIDALGTETLLIDSLALTGDILDLKDSIDASMYPNIRLQTFFADENLRTPSQLVRWQVVYDEVPEAAINPLKVSTFQLADTVQQGEEFTFITAIENISHVDMDSMQVSYRIVDDKFNNHAFTYTQKKPLLAGDVIYDTVTVNTTSLIALNNLWYEINPFVGDKPWQMEQHHFNNLILHKFYVEGDVKNPLLDVTFDGVHVLNGDIVNPKPFIVLSLNDENEFLPLDDPSLINLYINYPSHDGSDSLVLLDPTEYDFKPAVLPDNKCVIEFQGNFPNDGIYELRVLAQDRSSNISGDGDQSYDYRISFEIVNESSITQLINYPNPFSTSTRFVFTLTGSEVPENMLIQIMTISGKVVREITKDELGPIQIGKNISEFAWDGTDEFGDKLANGVYLYRVIVQNNGEDVKERNVTISTSEGTTSLSSKYFKKGIGKMYILR